MKVKELKAILSHLKDDDELVVSVLNQGKIGPSASVKVTNICSGFDWDNGTVIIYTEQPLTGLSPEDVTAIHKSVREAQSFHTMKLIRHLREKMADSLQETLDTLPTECPNCGFSLTGNK